MVTHISLQASQSHGHINLYFPPIVRYYLCGNVWGCCVENVSWLVAIKITLHDLYDIVCHLSMHPMSIMM